MLSKNSVISKDSCASLNIEEGGNLASSKIMSLPRRNVVVHRKSSLMEESNSPQKMRRKKSSSQRKERKTHDRISRVDSV